MLPLLRKEFLQLRRSPLLLVIFIILPVALMNMVPRIATQEIKGLKFSVVDADHSTLSSRLIQKIDASQYLALAATCPIYREALATVEKGEADIIVSIPHGYERDVVRTLGTATAAGGGAAATGSAISPTMLPEVQLVANATNGMKGSMSVAYVQGITQMLMAEVVEEQGLAATSSNIAAPAQGGAGPIAVRYLFNPHLDYRIYMVPAIFALLLTLIVGFLPALNIVGEKERGTIEQLNVTPVSKLSFIVAKLIPYWVIGIVMTFIALMAAKGLYGFWPVGSVGTMMVFVSLHCLLISAVGLVISNYSTTMRQAAMTMFFFLVIFILMSGLLTPIRSMPDWAQALTLINPMRFLIEALRAIYLKGSSLAELSSQFFTLSAMATAFATWAVVSYRKNE
ncbi:MAG: ABC transporter permease [Bacteroidales bacterium]|nr:ABC transporter permease [Bacteroidales bacterium]